MVELIRLSEIKGTYSLLSIRIHGDMPCIVKKIRVKLRTSDVRLQAFTYLVLLYEENNIINYVIP